jgi:hypothetical protein
MAATTYKINRTLHLDGEIYFQGTEAELELPDELRDRLVNNRTIQVIEPEAPVDETLDKKSK